MPTVATVLADLKRKSSEKTRATYLRHGSPPDRTLGVSSADMKLIAKTIKREQTLACELYDSGIFEAMYLAGMVADGRQLSKKQLDSWAEAAAHMPMVSEYTVPWVATESVHARVVALEWIKSKKEHVVAAGWRTYAGIVTTTPDEELDLAEVKALLGTIPASIDAAANRVRYTMNGFVIAVGTYVAPLLKRAYLTAEKIGVASVEQGDTACRVPLATDALAKIRSAGCAVKRKTIRC